MVTQTFPSVAPQVAGSVAFSDSEKRYLLRIMTLAQDFKYRTYDISASVDPLTVLLADMHRAPTQLEVPVRFSQAIQDLFNAANVPQQFDTLAGNTVNIYWTDVNGKTVLSLSNLFIYFFEAELKDGQNLRASTGEPLLKKLGLLLINDEDKFLDICARACSQTVRGFLTAADFLTPYSADILSKWPVFAWSIADADTLAIPNSHIDTKEITAARAVFKEYAKTDAPNKIDIDEQGNATITFIPLHLSLPAPSFMPYVRVTLGAKVMQKDVAAAAHVFDQISLDLLPEGVANSANSDFTFNKAALFFGILRDFCSQKLMNYDDDSGVACNDVESITGLVALLIRSTTECFERSEKDISFLQKTFLLVDTLREVHSLITQDQDIFVSSSHAAQAILDFFESQARPGLRQLFELDSKLPSVEDVNPSTAALARVVRYKSVLIIQTMAFAKVYFEKNDPALEPYLNNFLSFWTNDAILKEISSVLIAAASEAPAFVGSLFALGNLLKGKYTQRGQEIKSLAISILSKRLALTPPEQKEAQTNPFMLREAISSRIKLLSALIEFILVNPDSSVPELLPLTLSFLDTYSNKLLWDSMSSDEKDLLALKIVANYAQDNISQSDSESYKMQGKLAALQKSLATARDPSQDEPAEPLLNLTVMERALPFLGKNRQAEHKRAREQEIQFRYLSNGYKTSPPKEYVQKYSRDSGYTVFLGRTAANDSLRALLASAFKKPAVEINAWVKEQNRIYGGVPHVIGKTEGANVEFVEFPGLGKIEKGTTHPSSGTFLSVAKNFFAGSSAKKQLIDRIEREIVASGTAHNDDANRLLKRVSEKLWFKYPSEYSKNGVQFRLALFEPASLESLLLKNSIYEEDWTNGLNELKSELQANKAQYGKIPLFVGTDADGKICSVIHPSEHIQIRASNFDDAQKSQSKNPIIRFFARLFGTTPPLIRLAEQLQKELASKNLEILSDSTVTKTAKATLTAAAGISRTSSSTNAAVTASPAVAAGSSISAASTPSNATKQAPQPAKSSSPSPGGGTAGWLILLFTSEEFMMFEQFLGFFL